MNSSQPTSTCNSGLLFDGRNCNPPENASIIIHRMSFDERSFQCLWYTTSFIIQTPEKLIIRAWSQKLLTILVLVPKAKAQKQLSWRWCVQYNFIGTSHAASLAQGFLLKQTLDYLTLLQYLFGRQNIIWCNYNLLTFPWLKWSFV